MTYKGQQKAHFCQALTEQFHDFAQALATPEGEWAIKGFIDVYRNIYTVSVDTKVVSKLIELMLIPIIARFAIEHEYRLVLAEYQNHYPDISLIAADGIRIALDLKSTYRVSTKSINGFTLGAFSGYFRDRISTKNITFPYESYAAHFVLGIIYTRTKDEIDEKRKYTLGELQDIVSVIQDFRFLLREKWEIANDKPGSGNTKNIGSIRNINDLIHGKGPFSPYGEAVFDDYWMNYLTKDMARAIDSQVPYRNIEEYWTWRERAPRRE
jgi:hypothetical protein